MNEFEWRPYVLLYPLLVCISIYYLCLPLYAVRCVCTVYTYIWQSYIHTVCSWQTYDQQQSSVTPKIRFFVFFFLGNTKISSIDSNRRNGNSREYSIVYRCWPGQETRHKPEPSLSIFLYFQHQRRCPPHPPVRLRATLLQHRAALGLCERALCKHRFFVIWILNAQTHTHTRRVTHATYVECI